jgi:Tol biopolymer transport system component
MDRDGTNQTRLINLSDTGQMWISPVTDRIAYSHYDAGNVSVFLTSTRGTPPVRIPSPVKYTYFSSWSPEGRHIAVYGLDPSPIRLYVMNADGSNSISYENVSLDFISSSVHAGTSWSPNGTQMVFPFIDQGRTGLAMVDLSSGRVTDLTGSGGTYPQWSPDGSRIAFIRDGNVYIIRPDGSEEKKISHDGTADSLSWNPAGTRLAYSTEDMIGIVDPDGTNLTPLANVQPNQISWSTDGRTITFAPGAGVRIRIMTLSPGVVKMGEYMYRSLKTIEQSMTPPR